MRFVSYDLADNSKRRTKPSRDELAGYRLARRGDYRLIVRIDEDTHTVNLIDVKHRAHIYRPQ